MPKKKTVAALAVAAVAAVVLLVSFRLVRQPEIPTAKVARGAFTVKITREGQLRALKSLTVSSPSVGERLVITRLVPEGTFVRKGDFLVQFDTTELLKAIDGADRELVGARADLELISAKHDLRKRELDEELRKKEIEARRAEGGSPLDVENAHRELELARARQATELRVITAEALKAEISVKRVEERAISARKYLADLTVLAPGDGLVIHEQVWRSGREEKVQEGDSPWPGQPIISLPDLSTLFAATDIDETSISRIAVGQPSTVTLEAYPDTSFEGHVSTIGNLARPKFYGSGPNVFDLSVEFDQTDERFRPGMMAKVEIMVEAMDDVVSVPIEAVFEKQGKTVAYARRGRSFGERAVEVGRRNDTHVVILSGLIGGEEVALRDPFTEEGG